MTGENTLRPKPWVKERETQVRECRQLDPYARNPCLLVSRASQKYPCQLKANSSWM